MQWPIQALIYRFVGARVSENFRNTIVTRASSRVSAADRPGEPNSLCESLECSQWLGTMCKIGDENWKWCASHPNTILREWAALMIGLSDELTFARKLAWIKIFVEDAHVGLHRVACHALRGYVVQHTHDAIEKLVPWTGSRSERLRSYAAEITRPIGDGMLPVELLLTNPELGLPILDPLVTDDSHAVRTAVEAWLSDISTVRPDWVKATIQRWTNSFQSVRSTQSIAWLLKSDLIALDDEKGIH